MKSLRAARAFSIPLFRAELHSARGSVTWHTVQPTTSEPSKHKPHSPRSTRLASVFFFMVHYDFPSFPPLLCSHMALMWRDSGILEESLAFTGLYRGRITWFLTFGYCFLNNLHTHSLRLRHLTLLICYTCDGRRTLLWSDAFRSQFLIRYRGEAVTWLQVASTATVLISTLFLQRKDKQDCREAAKKTQKWVKNE